MDVRYERVGSAIKIGQGEKWMEILGCGNSRWLSHYGFNPLLQANLATGLS